MKQLMKVIVLITFTCLFLKSGAQVKDMIDMDMIQRKLHNKYKSTSYNDVVNNKSIEIDDFYGTGANEICIAKAIEAASYFMEVGRLKSGMKKSAEETIKIFGSTFKAFGFGFVVDGVKILSLLDDVQKEGGDADDFAKAIAKYAFDKGSGKLLEKAKEKAPGLFEDETLSGEGIKFLADMAKKESAIFFDKLINPPKEELFDYEEASTLFPALRTYGNCKRLFHGEIQSNEDELIEDHVGPVLIIKIGLTCECQKNQVGDLKDGIVRFNIPLDLVKNPNAWSQDDKRRKIFAAPLEYIYTLIEDKVTINATAQCCDGTNKISYVDPSKNADSNDDKGYFQIGTFVGLPIGEEKDFYSMVLGAELSYLFNINNNLSLGPEVGFTRFTGKDIGEFKTEGLSFIPVGGIIKYSFSEKIAVEGHIGYSFFTEENVDDGLNYGVGIGWEIAPGIVIQPNVSITNSGKNGNFNSFGIGFLYAFWRK